MSRSNTSTTTGTVTYSWDFDDRGTVSYCENVTVNTVGIEEQSLTDLIVYPNPSEGIFSVKASGEMKTSFITDLTGKVVYTKSLSGNEAIINTVNLANGSYFLSIHFIDGTNQKVRLEIVK